MKTIHHHKYEDGVSILNEEDKAKRNEENMLGALQ